MTEQEKQSITDELKQCKDNLKLLREKGNNVSLYKRDLALIERQVRPLKVIFQRILLLIWETKAYNTHELNFSLWNAMMESLCCQIFY